MYKIYAKNPPQGLQTPEVTSDTDLDGAVDEMLP